MVEIKVNYNNLTAVIVGISYLVHNLDLEILWKVLPLFDKNDAAMINGISICSKLDGSFDTEPFGELIQL